MARRLVATKYSEFKDSEQGMVVEIEDITYRLVVSNLNYMVLFKPGRSVYLGVAEGSQYLPARYIFTQIIDETEFRYILEEIFEIPVRRR